MPPSRELGAALGKLYRSLKNPKWLIAETEKLALNVVVINHLGKQVKAYFRHALHHDDGHAGDHHVDADGNEYIVSGGKKYRYDPASDAWYPA